MHCLRERQVKRLKKKNGCTISHFFRTAFYTKVHPVVSDDSYTYDKEQNWTKKNVYKNNIFQCQALFFPCNIGSQHWILIVAFLEEKSIQVFDSLFGSHRDRVIAIFNYLKDAYRATYPGSELPNQTTWRLYATNNHCPGQTNFYDCDVFVCMYADYIANGWPLIFNQTHINRC